MKVFAILFLVQLVVTQSNLPGNEPQTATTNGETIAETRQRIREELKEQRIRDRIEQRIDERLEERRKQIEEADRQKNLQETITSKPSNVATIEPKPTQNVSDQRRSPMSSDSRDTSSSIGILGIVGIIAGCVVCISLGVYASFRRFRVKKASFHRTKLPQKVLTIPSDAKKNNRTLGSNANEEPWLPVGLNDSETIRISINDLQNTAKRTDKNTLLG